MHIKKNYYFFQMVMVTFCDHLSGLVRGTDDAPVIALFNNDLADVVFASPY